MVILRRFSRMDYIPQQQQSLWHWIDAYNCLRLLRSSAILGIRLGAALIDSGCDKCD